MRVISAYPTGVDIQLRVERDGACAATGPSPHGGRVWHAEVKVEDRTAQAFASVAPKGFQLRGCDRHIFPMIQHVLADHIRSDAMREAAGIRPRPERVS